MTISANVSKAQFTGNGVATVFNMPAGFRAFSASHLIVTTTDPATGVVTVKTLNVDYTVAGVGLYTGVIVTMTVAPTNLHILDVKRVTPRLQSTDLRNQGAFFPEIHEDEFDYLTMLVQELNALVDYESKFNVAVPAAAATKAIAFTTARADANFGVTVSPNWNTNLWITNKTVNGFTVNFSVFAPAAAVIDWRAYA
jgi:hypothetical protein